MAHFQTLGPPTPDPFAYANMDALLGLITTISDVKQRRLMRQAQEIIMQSSTQEEVMGGLGNMRQNRPTGLGRVLDAVNPMTASQGPISQGVMNMAFSLPTKADIEAQELDREYREAQIDATEALTESRRAQKAKVRTTEQIGQDVEKTRKAKVAAEENNDFAMAEVYEDRMGQLEKEYADAQGLEFYEKPGKKNKFLGIDRLAKDDPPTMQVRKKTTRAAQPPPEHPDAVWSDEPVSEDRVEVMAPDGSVGTVPKGQLKAALKKGYKRHR